MSKENHRPLHPTLWRTCRVLAGKTRLLLLRAIVREPGLTVSRLAELTDIKMSRASQELRRLQSRGLVQARRNGGFVRYVPVPDPLVATAKPLLDALKAAFAEGAAIPDELLVATATALSDPRRLAIVAGLLNSPRNFSEIQAAMQIPAISLRRHLRRLNQLGLAGQARQVWCLIPARQPLARTLMHLLKSESR